MWGAQRLQTRLFTFLLLTTAVNAHRFRTTANLFFGSCNKVFQGTVTGRLAPAGPHLECAVALYRFSLSLLLDCPVNRSNWSDPVGSCCQMYESVDRGRERETRDVANRNTLLSLHPTFSWSSHAKTPAGRKCSYNKTSCQFPSSHLFSMLVAGYYL